MGSLRSNEENHGNHFSLNSGLVFKDATSANVRRWRKDVGVEGWRLKVWVEGCLVLVKEARWS